MKLGILLYKNQFECWLSVSVMYKMRVEYGVCGRGYTKQLLEGVVQSDCCSL